MRAANKLKILNDPIYGFITIPSEFIFDLIEHPYFQRLRRISQLGLTYLVYPGAYHTRFHHALGAMHLMTNALRILTSKKHIISDEEREAVLVAILLHDIGHGPFSHALENSIVNVSHERLSLEFMKALNEEFNGKLSLAIQIFENKYSKKFLYQLISSQLDMDRLDYLRRDSFYTGVSEGQVNTERLITMLNVADDELVVDGKGIYSVEKFLVARRLMYWQVYLHKTVLSAEFLLLHILKRAKEVFHTKMRIPSALQFFLSGNHLLDDKVILEKYALLDDYDVMSAIKEWSRDSEPILKRLCQMLLNRKLLGVKILDIKMPKNKMKNYREKIAKKFDISEEESHYFVFQKTLTNNAYQSQTQQIKLLDKSGQISNLNTAADHPYFSALAQPVEKHFVFMPKALI